MLTKENKEEIIDAFKLIDVKKLDVDHKDEQLIKWFRFGSYNGMQMAIEIIKQMPEKKPRKKVIKLDENR